MIYEVYTLKNMPMDDSSKNSAMFTKEILIRLTVWQKIKNEWWYPKYAEKLYVDDKDHALAVKIEGSLILLGYFHYEKENVDENVLK